MKHQNIDKNKKNMMIKLVFLLNFSRNITKETIGS